MITLIVNRHTYLTIITTCLHPTTNVLQCVATTKCYGRYPIACLVNEMTEISYCVSVCGGKGRALKYLGIKNQTWY